MIEEDRLINENAIYDEWGVLVQDRKRSAKLFVTTFIGFIALYTYRDTPHSSLVSYFRSTKRITGGVTPNSNDLALVVNLGIESGLLRQRSAYDILKLLYLLSKGAVDVVDEEYIRSLIKPNLLIQMELTGKIKIEYNKYISGTINMYQMMYNLRSVIIGDELSSEFERFFRLHINGLKKRAGLTDDDSDEIDA